MTRQFEADVPWRLHVASHRNVLSRARIIGFKPHPYLLNDWMYVDIDGGAAQVIAEADSRAALARPKTIRATPPHEPAAAPQAGC